jgi:hypothetical protein
MNKLVDSTDRGATDYLHFGAVFFGVIFVAAGVVLVSVPVTGFGLFLIALGVAFFLARNR